MKVEDIVVVVTPADKENDLGGNRPIREQPNNLAKTRFSSLGKCMLFAFSLSSVQDL